MVGPNAHTELIAHYTRRKSPSAAYLLILTESYLFFKLDPMQLNNSFTLSSLPRMWHITAVGRDSLKV